MSQSAKAMTDSLHAEVKSLKARTVDAEKLAAAFRIELTKLGLEYQRQIDELVIVVLSLIEQVEQLGGKPNVDMKMLERIAHIRHE